MKKVKLLLHIFSHIIIPIIILISGIALCFVLAIYPVWFIMYPKHVFILCTIAIATIILLVKIDNSMQNR